MYKEALRPVWAEINLTNLDYNIKQIKNKIGDREMIGVIKADAYGHGSVKVAGTAAKLMVNITAIVKKTVSILFFLMISRLLFYSCIFLSFSYFSLLFLRIILPYLEE